MSSLIVVEHSSSRYRDRTEYNVEAADLTVAFANNFETAGERLTRNLAGRRYLAIPLDTSTEDAAAMLLRHVRGLGVKTLNVAGNSLHTLGRDGISQESVNEWVHAVLSKVHEASPLQKVVSGGQTGVDLAAGVAATALNIPCEMTLPRGFLQRDADGQDLSRSRADIERQVYAGVARVDPKAVIPASQQRMKWIDLSAVGVFVKSYSDCQKGSGLTILDVEGKHDKQIRALGFVPASGEFSQGVYVSDAVDTSALVAAFGTENVQWKTAAREEIDAAFNEQFKKKAKMNADVFFAQQKTIGMNHLKESVYEGVTGRFVLRRDENKRAVMVREGAAGIDGSIFLRASNPETLAQVSYGFVMRTIPPFRERLRREDLKALMELSNQGGFTLRDYQENVEAAANRLFKEEVARTGRSGIATFAIANTIFTSLPGLTERTSNSVANQQYSTPLPMSALAQALLTKGHAAPGASYLDPTIGNGNLVSMIEDGEVFGVEIDDDRIARLPNNVTQCVHGDATTVNFRTVFGKHDGFDYVIANPPFAPLEQPVEVPLPLGSLVESVKTQKLDHLLLLQSLHARKPDGRAVFITGADGTLKDGEVTGRSKQLLAYLYDHYEVDGVVDVAGELYRKQGASYPLRMYVIGKRLDVPREYGEMPSKLPVIRTYDGLKHWAARVMSGEGLEDVEGIDLPKEGLAPEKKEVISKVESVTELLQEAKAEEQPQEAAAEAAEDDYGAVEDEREDNQFQQPYVAYSKTGDATTMIPANLSGPVYEALAKVKETYGDIDEYVGKCLRYSFEDLKRYFSPEQVDALALIFHAHDRNMGFLLADKMGVGKGRVLAAVARRERLEGRIPVFVTVGSNLFTDFLERDLADIGSRDLFKAPFLINDGAATLDSNGDVAIKAKKRDEYRKYAEAGELPEGTDMVMLTYSQLARRPETHLTSRYLGTLAERYPLSLLLDESHNGAGASNTSQNLEYMIDCLARRGKVTYSSGTPIKGAKNLRLYKRILPDGINHDELLAAVQADPLSLQEALNYEIASQGCMVCRELDDAGINRDFVMSEDVERNRAVADQMAEILTAMSFLSGDIQKIVIRMNRDFEKELAEIPEKDREGARMGASSMNFGSRLHQINRQFLLALKARDVVKLTLGALEDNRKPIIALQHTGESLLTDFVTRANEKYLDDKERVSKKAGAVILDKPVTFRDLMHKYLERIQHIKVMQRYGEYAQRRASSEEVVDAVERIKHLIDALPEDLPLTPIDYVREELGKHGYSVGEISGRGLQAISLPDGGVSIEPVVGKGDKTRIVKTARAFNNGEVDVLMITESGSTGLSVQASPAVGKDIRPRRMVKWEMQPDIAKERQMDGRPDRTGQVCKPDYQIPMTGLPADDRQAMMFNNKNRNLTASTVANRDSKQIIREVPDLLNVVGDKVAEELLYAKPELAAHLDIDLPDDLEDAWRKPPLFWINKLTGRISLLRVAEQEALYAELQGRFTELLDKFKAEGANPLEVSCLDWKAKQVSRQHYMGQADTKRAVSSFNDAIYLTTVQYQQEMRAVRADEIDDRINKRIEMLAPLGVKSAADVHYRAVSSFLEANRGAILQKHLGRRFGSLVAALQDKNPNEVKNVNEKIIWLMENLPNLGYGAVYMDGELDGTKSPRVVTRVNAATTPDSYTRLSDWSLEVMKPGSDVTETVTLSSLYSKGLSFQRWRFKDNPPVRMHFDKAENGIVTRTARILDGNLFEAVAMNLRHSIGTKVVYTDETGSRQHGVLVHSHISTSKLLAIPERVRDPAVLAAVLGEGAPLTNDQRGECFGSEAKHAVVLIRNQYGQFELRTSTTKTHGAWVYADPALTRIKGQEHKCIFNLNFSEYSGKMTASVPQDAIFDVINYLVTKKNIDFYVKDRQTLEKVRGNHSVAGNERSERATSLACG